MDLNSIFSTLENISKKVEGKDRIAEEIKSEFDKAIGISKEQHDKVDSLLETYDDAEEAVQQYETQINECSSEIVNLRKTIKDLEDELNTLTNPSDRNRKQAEIDEKKDELSEKTSKREGLRDSQEKEDETKRRTEQKFKKLTGKGITNDIKNAFKAQNASLASNASKSGMVSGVLGKLKMNPYMIAVEGLVKAIEFGIGKATDYMKLNYENLIRQLNATTTVSLNEMKASLSSWQDAVNGAYMAQEMAISSQMAMMEAQNATELANMKMAHTWTNWVPIWGEINKYNETALEMEQKIAETRLSNASKIIQQVNEFTKKTDDYIKKQDKAIRLYQAENGLSATQTNVFEERMLSKSEEFAKFNKTIEDVLKIQSGYAEQSGRTVNFSDDDYMQTIAVGRLTGDDNLVNFQSQMQLFNHSVSDAAEIMYNMYMDVNKMGLSQKKVTKDVLANLKLANKYDFKNGTKGFIELAKWAENARFNLSSLGNMVEKVQSGGLEGVITQSAKLQVLGGSFAMNADPLRMGYLANSDPEEYTKMVKDSFKGLGTFDKNTGETSFSFTENQMIRAAAEAYGMNVEDAKNMIREDNKKEVVKKQMYGSTLSKEEQEAVANKAQRDATTGEWYVETIGGEKIGVGDVQKGDIENILSSNNDEAAIQYAQSTMSLVEKIEATTKQIDAKLGALTFSNFQQLSQEQIEASLEAYEKYSGNVQKAIQANRYDAQAEQKIMLDSLGGIDKEYKESKVAVDTKGKHISYDTGEDLRSKFINKTATNDEIDLLKQHPQYRQGLTTEQLKSLRKKDTRGISVLWDWDRDTKWVPGDEGDEATDYRAIPRKKQQEMIVQGYASIGALPFKDAVASTNKTPMSITANTIRNVQDGIAAISQTADLKDKIASGNGKSMAVVANNVIPIHDGTATIAQSDPQDSAIFAKTGGPFDKLFNGIFDKINKVYGIFSDTAGQKGEEHGIWEYARKRGDDKMLSNAYESFMDSPFYARYQLMEPDITPNNSIVENQKNSALDRMRMKVFTEATGQNYGTVINTPSDILPRSMPYDSFVADALSDESFNAVNGNNNGNIKISFEPLKLEGKLELSNNGQSIDLMKEIQNNPLLLRSITEMISQTISSKLNGGKSTFNGNNMVSFK